MKLLTKFNLVLVVLFGTGGLIISQVTYTFLIKNARREVLQEAELMMTSAKSVRDYTSSDLAPLLEQNPQHKERFLAETVPAFAAISIFNKLRQKYPDYTYQEPRLGVVWVNAGTQKSKSASARAKVIACDQSLDWHLSRRAPRELWLPIQWE